MESQSTTVKVHWIAGHVDSNGNELADKAAMEAAIDASTLPKSLTNNTRCHLYDLQPMVSMKAYRSLYRRKAESKVNRLKMGHSLLKQHLHRIAIIDNPTGDCGTDRETPEHTIFQNNAVHRDILMDTIELS